MLQKYDNLYLCSLTPEQHQRTCNYWYTVTSSVCTAHTAFETERGLYRWIRERGLELSAPLPQRGTHSHQRLIGRYSRHTTLNANLFASLQGEHTKVLDNGEYTLGILTHDADGDVVVNLLNCNIKTRPVYDYWTVAKEMR